MSHNPCKKYSRISYPDGNMCHVEMQQCVKGWIKLDESTRRLKDIVSMEGLISHCPEETGAVKVKRLERPQFLYSTGIEGASICL
jgi:hypothetical protein